MQIRIDLTEEPYFGIVFRGLRHWRDMHARSVPLAANSSAPSLLLELTANIVAAYVRTNSLPPSGLIPMIEAVHKMILQLAEQFRNSKVSPGGFMLWCTGTSPTRSDHRLWMLRLAGLRYQLEVNLPR